VAVIEEGNGLAAVVVDEGEAITVLESEGEGVSEGGGSGLEAAVGGGVVGIGLGPGVVGEGGTLMEGGVVSTGFEPKTRSESKREIIAGGL
jgi:hypothetical protein